MSAIRSDSDRDSSRGKEFLADLAAWNREISNYYQYYRPQSGIREKSSFCFGEKSGA